MPLVSLDLVIPDYSTVQQTCHASLEAEISVPFFNPNRIKLRITFISYFGKKTDIPYKHTLGRLCEKKVKNKRVQVNWETLFQLKERG